MEIKSIVTEIENLDLNIRITESNLESFKLQKLSLLNNLKIKAAEIEKAQSELKNAGNKNA